MPVPNFNISLSDGIMLLHEDKTKKAGFCYFRVFETENRPGPVANRNSSFTKKITITHRREKHDRH